ncbi:hypothetical protein EMIHUDRAFT_220508 [Emiliania huxleyi CCMP1516]|uniref:Secreted protein n=2 Tax=Emiliania huxleyi TaxID=2903 RepID=A0A0D3I186_EMIH1|nr:hypothetical protein EMIHUDRAFT_220508 [Emiliania huxleyi CCMP1516]EOD05021.1 hypothetical protein EMIHUDRAFT_220508 [Emiliania huxleyi CCMP1516]|eukprot:XP_005757450.1 hypothetical protein EMIHUDRAFT_220508 [Emiliania huxleyi CCMP1516]
MAFSALLSLSASPCLFVSCRSPSIRTASCSLFWLADMHPKFHASSSFVTSIFLQYLANAVRACWGVIAFGSALVPALYPISLRWLLPIEVTARHDAVKVVPALVVTSIQLPNSEGRPQILVFAFFGF